jgi:glycosyltransferase involved in cell wall biosynthesis
MSSPRISVIVSTYNQPRWLLHCLTGFAQQSLGDFELIVADDGSSRSTAQLIETVATNVHYPLRHVWHEDNGFRKCTILNRGIEASTTDYLVFTDGDCIPRNDFLATHVRLRHPGRFLSGGYVKLPHAVSDTIRSTDIENGRHVDPQWLKARGFRGGRQRLKLRPPGVFAQALDLLSPARASWNGHNASGWKSDLIAVNGFDERMRYGGEDRELGERLENAGIRGKRIRFRTALVHLDHDRPYIKASSIADNQAIRDTTRQRRSTWTEFGLRPGPRA